MGPDELTGVPGPPPAVAGGAFTGAAVGALTVTTGVPPAGVEVAGGAGVGPELAPGGVELAPGPLACVGSVPDPPPAPR